MCRDQVRKVEAYLALNPVSDVKANKKCFYWYICSRMTTTEDVGLLLKGVRNLDTKDMQKAKVLNAFFTSAFTDKTGLQQFQVPEKNGRVQGKVDFSLVQRIMLGNVQTNET